MARAGDLFAPDIVVLLLDNQLAGRVGGKPADGDAEAGLVALVWQGDDEGFGFLRGAFIIPVAGKLDGIAGLDGLASVGWLVGDHGAEERVVHCGCLGYRRGERLGFEGIRFILKRKMAENDTRRAPARRGLSPGNWLTG